MSKLPLFEYSQQHSSQKPLAELLRPQSIDDYVGQQHLLGENAPLRKLISNDQIPSLIFWGPPGVGKTSLAQLIAKLSKRPFHKLSAISSGVKDLREVIDKTKEEKIFYKKTPLLFIDEIHRFNKSQQDGLLPYVEDGTIILIGATTENPSFEVIAPLLSRCKTFTLKTLEKQDLEKLFEKALHYFKTQFHLSLQLEEEARHFLIDHANGDARVLLNHLEMIIGLNKANEKITLQTLQEITGRKNLSYDKKSEQHYNIISAFIKSLRGSDPNAALYYLACMLEAGEDPLFILRRLLIFASEDIGNANPQALTLALSATQTFERIGLPEGWIPLAHVTTYLASSPKSNASYQAYKLAKEDVLKHGILEIPLHLRNAPTNLMKDLGYGKNYQYPHQFEGNFVEENYLPQKLKNQRYYQPTNNGEEKIIREFLKEKKKCD